MYRSAGDSVSHMGSVVCERRVINGAGRLERINPPAPIDNQPVVRSPMPHKHQAPSGAQRDVLRSDSRKKTRATQHVRRAPWVLREDLPPCRTQSKRCVR